MPHPLYLVRHGESEWNVLRLTQGQTVHPKLTVRGRDQARAAAALIAADLAGHGLDVGLVVTSDLTRAVETAEILVDVLGGELRHDKRLREQHLGSLEGRDYDETWAAAADIDWSTPDVAVAGGETLREVHDRMAAVLAGVERAHTTVVVSHGDAIRAAFAWLRGIEPHRAAWVDVPNGAVARVDADRSVRWLTPSA